MILSIEPGQLVAANQGWRHGNAFGCQHAVTQLRLLRVEPITIRLARLLSAHASGRNPQQQFGGSWAFPSLSTYEACSMLDSPALGGFENADPIGNMAGYQMSYGHGPL